MTTVKKVVKEYLCLDCEQTIDKKMKKNSKALKQKLQSLEMQNASHFQAFVSKKHKKPVKGQSSRKIKFRKKKAAKKVKQSRLVYLKTQIQLQKDKMSKNELKKTRSDGVLSEMGVDGRRKSRLYRDSSISMISSSRKKPKGRNFSLNGETHLKGPPDAVKKSQFSIKSMSAKKNPATKNGKKISFLDQNRER